MLKSWKKRKDGEKPFLYEEKPELKNLELTAQTIRTQIGESADIIFSDLWINGNQSLPATLVFVDGLVNSKNIDDDILKPLLQENSLSQDKTEKDVINRILSGGVYHSSSKIRDSIDEAIEDILSGSAALVFSKEKKAVTFDIRGFAKRSITEPSGENVIKGAKDAFIEVLKDNTAIIRRKIRSQNLRIKQTKVGQQTYTDIAVVWLEGIANKDIVDKVFKRLNNIRTDGAISLGSIEEFIVDNKWSSFPQTIFTERSDKCCQNILDGRVAVIIDGLPSVYIVPATFNMFFKAPEDYSNNYIIASAISTIRYVSYFMSLLLPGFYIAITTFHQEMIPTELALSIIKSKEGVPFPTSIEIIGMLFSFELLIEASVCLPRTIGQAVSIMGAVIVGQTAVSAKILSPGVVIIIAITGVAGFTMPNQDFSNAVRLWRFIFVLCAIIAGLFTIVMGMLVMGYVLVKIETFGVPYFTPFTSNEGREILQDTLLRLPLGTMKQRNASLKSTNKRR